MSHDISAKESNNKFKKKLNEEQEDKRSVARGDAQGFAAGNKYLKRSI